MLAPHMEVLRRKHKDDPKTLNQEVMALYRAHNVNPMMGCLPMLVQMPVLYALFQLFYARNLFGNATVLGLPWVRLDDIPCQSLFGGSAGCKVAAAIPHHPEVLSLLLFPALVALTTWYQQRMTVTDPQQARMFVFMPIMVGAFGMLYQIGLSIYWITSTVAYIGEYYLVVGKPHPMVSAPPKSQAQAGGGGQRSGGAGQAPAGGGRPTSQQPQSKSMPQGKKGAKRA